MTGPSNDEPPILVLGATGAQGGAVVRALVAQKRRVRALVRDPHADAARALGDQGIELAVGNLDDPSSLERAVDGAFGVFSLQVANADDVPAETRQAGALMRAAKDAGVSVFIQSSVCETSKDRMAPGFPIGSWQREYWENKLVIERAALGSGFPYAVVLKPALMMENLIAPKALRMFPDLAYGRIVTALESSKPISFVAADDIGRMAAAVFSDPGRFTGASIELVGDVLTLPQVARVLSKAWGEEIWAETRLPENLVSEGRYLAWVQTQKWINAIGFSANTSTLTNWGLKPTPLADWAEAHQDQRLAR